jgi:hypothetical protein
MPSKTRISAIGDAALLALSASHAPGTRSLQRMVPAYFTTIQDWLAKRIRGFGPRDSRSS